MLYIHLNHDNFVVTIFIYIFFNNRTLVLCALKEVLKYEMYYDSIR